MPFVSKWTKLRRTLHDLFFIFCISRHQGCWIRLKVWEDTSWLFLRYYASNIPDFGHICFPAIGFLLIVFCLAKKNESFVFKTLISFILRQAYQFRFTKCIFNTVLWRPTHCVNKPLKRWKTNKKINHEQKAQSEPQTCFTRTLFSKETSSSWSYECKIN